MSEFQLELFPNGGLQPYHPIPIYHHSKGGMSRMGKVQRTNQSIESTLFHFKFVNSSRSIANGEIVKFTRLSAFPFIPSHGPRERYATTK